MWRLTKSFAILLVCYPLMSCSSLTVRAKELTLPPLPPEVMAPCPEWEPLPDGYLSTLYLQMLKDAATYQECKRRQATLAAMVKYQEEVRAAYAQSLNQSAKNWWWPW